MHKGRTADHRRIINIKSIPHENSQEYTDLDDFIPDNKCHEDVCFIMAYVDGELDEDGRRIIETMLESDPKANETAETLRSMTMLLREAFLKTEEQ